VPVYDICSLIQFYLLVLLLCQPERVECFAILVAYVLVRLWLDNGYHLQHSTLPQSEYGTCMPLCLVWRKSVPIYVRVLRVKYLHAFACLIIVNVRPRAARMPK